MFAARNTIATPSAPLVKFSASMTTFPVSVKPSGWVTTALNPNTSLDSRLENSILVEGDSPDVWATWNEYFTAVQFGVTVPGNGLYSMEVTNGNRNSTDRWMGVAIPPLTGSTWLIAFGCADGGMDDAIATISGGTLTIRGTTSRPKFNGSDRLKLVPTRSGSDITWTVWKNDVVTSITWTDTGGAIFGEPGRTPGCVMRQITNWGRYGSQGVSGYSIQEL